MVVQHNLTAMNAQRQLGISNTGRAKTTEKLSSGYRINRAADDAAGLAISEKMRRQIRGLTQASANAQDGISLVQIADGAMAEVHDMLQRGTELSVKAANGTLTDTDRQYIQQEIEQLKEELDGIAQRTSFNEIRVLQGGRGSAATGSVTIHGSMPSWAVMSSATKLQDCNWTTAPTRYEYTTSTGGTGYLDHANKHEEATIDFSAFQGTDQQLTDLIGNGFHATCCTCNRYYSVEFTNGTATDSKISGSHHIYQVGIDDLKGKNGEDLVNKILMATGNGVMDDHYIRMQAGNINATYKATLHIYDQRPSETQNEIGFPAGATNIKSGEKYATSFGVKADIAAGMGVFGPGYATASTIPGKEDTPKKIDLQVGAEKDQVIEVILPAIDAEVMSLNGVNVATQKGAQSAIALFKNANEYVSTERSRMGAYQNRLEHTIKNLDNVIENTTAAESLIRDTDMAEEMVHFSNQNIIQQAGQTMLAQANQDGQNVLRLLQG